MVDVDLSVPSKDIDEYQADDRGRITLGAEDYAHKKVEVAILEVKQPADAPDPE